MKIKSRNSFFGPLPLVSVCMPAYNAERYVGAAIESVLRQSYPTIELIIVDDGSTDRTSGVLATYRSRDPRVRIFRQENRGHSAAANRAFELSNGEYVKFLDADDLISPGMIRDQVRRLNRAKDSVATAAWGRFWGDDLHSFRLNPEHAWQHMDPVDWLVDSMKNGPNMMQCGLFLIPREVLNECGLWNRQLSLMNDFDFFIRVLLSSKKILFTPGTILYYRSGLSGSLSARKSPAAYLSAFRSAELGATALLERERSARVRKVCADTFQLWKYQFFPRYPDLYRQAQRWVTELGGSAYAFPCGGVSKRITKVFGWKVARLLQELRKMFNTRGRSSEFPNADKIKYSNHR